LDLQLNTGALGEYFHEEGAAHEPLEAKGIFAAGVRHDIRVRAPNPDGNERLTCSTGLVLLILLAAETLTTLALRTYLNVHLFLGLLLLPPVALKLASTGWRFARYYTRNEPYVRAGPPRMLMRVLAPLLVASTLALFGTGVAMIVVGHRGGQLRTLHTFSFVAWGVLIGVHVLAYLVRVLRDGTMDWRRNAVEVVAGVRSRRAILVGALLAGVVLASTTLPAQRTILRHGGHASTVRAAAHSASSARRPTAVAMAGVTRMERLPRMEVL
jgi:hypothetical protein